MALGQRSRRQWLAAPQRGRRCRRGVRIVGNGKSPNSKSSSGHRPLFAYGGDFGPSGTPSDHNFCIVSLHVVLHVLPHA